MTVATMHRWATTVNFLYMSALEEPWPLCICPVNVQPLATNDSSYHLIPTGGFFAKDSQHLIIPGDYCLYRGGTKPTIEQMPFDLTQFMNLQMGWHIPSISSMTCPSRHAPVVGAGLTLVYGRWCVPYRQDIG